MEKQYPTVEDMLRAVISTDEYSETKAYVAYELFLQPSEYALHYLD